MMTKPDQPSVRTLRVGEEMRHALSDVLARGGLRDPALDAWIVSVTEVRLAPDLKVATVFVRALGTENQQPLVKALAANAKAIRAELARRVNLRFTPDLRFRADESFDAGAKIEAILKRPEVARDIRPKDDAAA